jgi:GGDEF domain-containing protein
VVDQGEVAGMLTVRDLLHAAAEMIDEGHSRTAPLTGLPGRVRCDEHVAGLLGRAASRNPQEPSDAALIDIRNFHDYNGAYGYELGDQLLKRLAVMIQDVARPGESGVFIGHLNDDRFLVTAPAGVLPGRMQQLVREFDAAVHEFVTETPPGAGDGAGTGTIGRLIADGPARVGLRVVLVHNAFARIATARELYRIAKDAARADAAPQAGRAESVLIESDGAPRTARRLSA